MNPIEKICLLVISVALIVRLCGCEEQASILSGGGGADAVAG